MENTAHDMSLIDTGEEIFYLHDKCDRCDLPLLYTSGLTQGERRILDATGDIYVTLVRSPDGSGLWDMDVQVYERGADPVDHPKVTHVKTVGVARYTPPGVPPWLWTAYSHLGELCTHFMDEHEDIGEPERTDFYARQGPNAPVPGALG